MEKIGSNYFCPPPFCETFQAAIKNIKTNRLRVGFAIPLPKHLALFEPSDQIGCLDHRSPNLFNLHLKSVLPIIRTQQ